VAVGDVAFYLALLEPITVIRAIQEERVVEATFREEYGRYRARTWL
jgi:protein-S-isoprenylcysteine O-methyltransferase Ste14